MTILTSYTSTTNKAQIYSSPDQGFKKIYTGTSTESEGRAARNLVAKWFGFDAAQTVRLVRDPSEASALVGKFFDDPKRKQIFTIWTFKTKPKQA